MSSVSSSLRKGSAEAAFRLALFHFLSFATALLTRFSPTLPTDRLRRLLPVDPSRSSLFHCLGLGGSGLFDGLLQCHGRCLLFALQTNLPTLMAESPDDHDLQGELALVD